MRDPERIKPLLAKLEALWVWCPDLRFGQLLANLTRGRDLFAIQDEDTEKLIDVALLEWPANYVWPKGYPNRRGAT